MAANYHHTLALADEGSVYSWAGWSYEPGHFALGLGPAVRDAGKAVLTPQRIPALRVACAV
jgi:hypothetical protein